MKPRTIAVTGGGVMGAQIAQVFATHGHTVRVHDLTEDRLAAARERILDGRFGLRASVARGKISEEASRGAQDRLTYVTDLAAACDGVDLVQEAVPEDMGLKVRVFRELDRVSPPGAVLLSNTAGLSVAALAYATDRPGQVFGWHWFQPCAAMRCAELVVHDAVTPEAHRLTVEVAESCGRRVVTVNDQPLAWGFVANRINAAVRREADMIVAEGVATPEQVDAIMKDALRWPMGPFEMRGAAALG
ncbi:3-hydroxyacyl-CoA dehydrogenase family protein [Streptosporangium carneum]|uniref:3-hydroxyacyl-CoA dehydrogenase family protein n=1 Tax=Streptosporangium carneum TaxID=47481 RepID=UPI0022F30498|nr:3-hydroxyacyl-CoA dehydrogenase family protein [Streptosporangium carneum]